MGAPKNKPGYRFYRISLKQSKRITLTKESLTNITFIVFAVILLSLSLFSYQRVYIQASASDWVNHTQLVKFKLSDIHSSLANAESSAKSFAMTNYKAYLNEFNNIKESIPQKITEIESLISDNSEQTTNLKSLSSLLQQRLQFMQAIVDRPRTYSVESIDTAFLKQKTLSGIFNRQIGKMIAVEDMLMTKRLDTRAKEKTRTATLVLLFSIISIVFLVFSFFRLKKERRLLTLVEVDKMLLEKKVQERTIEIKNANEILNNKNLELQQRNAELDSFTYIASHDLKEPLRKVEMYAGRILDTDGTSLSERSTFYLKRQVESVQRMRNLLDDIFSYARMEKSLQFVSADLNEIIRLSISTLQEIIEETGATIEYHNLPTLNVVPLQMEQLFTNLIGNALKYRKKEENPQIKIWAELRSRMDNDAFWVIYIEDNGIGFEEAYKDKIFQVFQRLHSKAEYSGTGIGLAICKKVAENHGGTIDACSIKGKGSTFIVKFPENNIK